MGRALLFVPFVVTALALSGCIQTVEPLLRFAKTPAAGPSLGLSKSGLVLVEGAVENVDIVLTNIQEIDTIVALSLTSLDASGRFQPLPATVTIPAGTLSTTVPLVTIDDAFLQPRQNWKLLIGVVGATVATTQSELTIWLDDNDGGTTGGGTTTTGPILFKDFNDAPAAFKAVPAKNGKLLFAGNDAAHGTELWVSDGTGIGTYMLQDFAAGTDSGMPQELYADPISGLVYFSRYYAGVKGELWVTDGTQAGTVLVKTFTGGGVGTIYKTIGNRTLFSAYTSPSTTGAELWSTDGTPAGTFELADFTAGVAGSQFRGFDEYNGFIYFSVNPGNFEIWKTDGTIAGTSRVIRSYTGTTYNDVECLLVHGGTLYFKGFNAADGRQLWKTDGTTPGTVQVKKISNSGNACPLGTAGSRLILDSYNAASTMRIYASDGTSAGTIDLAPTVNYVQGFGASVNGKFVYKAGDTAGVEPWVTDGTPAGTARLLDVFPGATTSNPEKLGVLGTKLLFSANNGTEGVELWVTDGTTAGTFRLKDINPGAGSSYPSEPTLVGSKLYFSARSASGVELWVTDGTASGTREVADLVPGSKGSAPVGMIASDSSHLYFAAYNFALGQPSMFVTDGTATGTIDLPNAKMPSGSSYSNVTAFGSKAVFATTGEAVGAALWSLETGSATPAKLVDGVASGLQVCNGSLYFHHYVTGNNIDGALWKSTGTAATTALVKTGIENSVPISCVSGKATFLAQTPASGLEPWVSDGTTAGTTILRETVAGTGSSFSYSYKFGQNTMSGLTYLEADNQVLWRTDGTVAGTSALTTGFPATTVYNETYVYTLGTNSLLVFEDPFDNSLAGTARLYLHDGVSAPTRILPVVGFEVQYTGKTFARVGSKYLFAGTDGSSGTEPWVTDGTSAGTYMLKDLVVGASGGAKYGVVVVEYGTKALFDFDDGSGVWITDGTVAGTTSLSSNVSLADDETAVLDGYLYFTGYKSGVGHELWRTDGTTAGTTMVADAWAGPDSSRPKNLTAFNGKLYFSAETPAAGREFWVSDGTAAGTKLLTDINPGPSDSNPENFQIAAGKLFLRANKIMIGTETFMMEP